MMNKPFASGKGRLVGRGTVYPVPIPLDPAAFVGSLVVGLDPTDQKRKLYFSDGTEWTRSIFDTTISEEVERIIGDLILNGFDEEDLPDPTLPENLRRYVFNNDKGLPGFVWEDEWNYLTDEARVAEIAEEVGFDAIRVSSEVENLTVHMTDSSADYTSVRDAIDYLSLRIPSAELPPLAFNIHILSGHVETKQIIQREGSFGSVRITAEDPEVIVDENGIIEPATSGGTWPFYEFLVNPPVISCLFRSNQARTDLDTVGMLVRSGIYANGLSRDDESETPPDAGFSHFNRNLSLRFGSYGRLFTWSKHTNARTVNVELLGAGSAVVEGDLTEAGSVGLLVDSGSFVQIAPGANCRRDPNQDGMNDIVVGRGGTAFIRSGAIGGTNQKNLIQTTAGLILDSRISSIDKLVESGTGPNGSFTRWADGRQECRMYVTEDDVSFSSNEGAYISPRFTYIYPASFSEPPSAQVTHVRRAGDTAVVWASIDNPPGVNSIDLRANKASSGTHDIGFSIAVFGRWF